MEILFISLVVINVLKKILFPSVQLALGINSITTCVIKDHYHYSEVIYVIYFMDINVIFNVFYKIPICMVFNFKCITSPYRQCR